MHSSTNTVVKAMPFFCDKKWTVFYMCVIYKYTTVFLVVKMEVIKKRVFLDKIFFCSHYNSEMFRYIFEKLLLRKFCS